MLMKAVLTLDEFAEIAEVAGVRIGPDELVEMRTGYLGLRKMLANLPQESDFLAESAVVLMTPDRSIR
jgi:hypothetical protein